MRKLPFVLAASDHGPVIVSRLDFHQVPQGIYGVGYQILEQGAYEADEMKIIKQVLDTHKHEGNLVIALDIGANIGINSLEMAHHLRGWGEVISFEAQTRLYYALCGNIALHNVFNCQAFNHAVGASCGSINVPKPDYFKPASYGSLELKLRPDTEYIGQSVSYFAKDLVTVNLISIDSLNLPRVDFIKIDVEGMEEEVLAGAENVINTFKPSLLIEWLKSDEEAIRRLLVSKGYNVCKIGLNLLASAK